MEIGDSVVSINGEENFIGRSSDIIASDQLVMFWERGPFTDTRVLVIAKEADEAWGLKFKPDGTITEIIKGKAVDKANITRKPEAQIRPGDRLSASTVFLVIICWGQQNKLPLLSVWFGNVGGLEMKQNMTKTIAQSLGNHGLEVGRSCLMSPQCQLRSQEKQT